jgi:hypothetical protein
MPTGFAEEIGVIASRYSAAIAGGGRESGDAGGHGRAGAADRIGLVVVGDRRHERRGRQTRPDRRRAGWIGAAEARQEADAANTGLTCSSRARRASIVVVRQRWPTTCAERAQDLPVLARLARRIDRQEAALHAAFGVDVGAGFFSV